MEQRILGRSGISVPVVGMGTWRTFDVRGATLEAARKRVVDAALGWYGGRVDIYQIHNLVAWQTHLPVLEKLRDEGQVKVVGATHYLHSEFPELVRLMRSGRIGQIQIPYNVADRVVEREVLAVAHDAGIGVIGMRPLGGGELIASDPGRDKLEPLREFGVTTWVQALLKWILSDPRIHSVIPATSHADRMRANADAGAPPWFDTDTRDYVSRLIG